MLLHIGAKQEDVAACLRCAPFQAREVSQDNPVEETAARGLDGGAEVVLCYAAVALPQHAHLLYRGPSTAGWERP